jgi:hypothetical protein
MAHVAEPSRHLSKMAASKKPVELHSHDFEWEELARECERDGAFAADAKGDDDGAELDELGDVAKAKWDEFHQRNHGAFRS